MDPRSRAVSSEAIESSGKYRVLFERYFSQTRLAKMMSSGRENTGGTTILGLKDKDPRGCCSLEGPNNTCEARNR
jgi:hypothetical protein